MAKVVGIMLVPLGLILLQPDLGTGLVFVAITMGMLLVGGLKGRYFLVFALIAVLMTGTVFKLHLLKDYQEDRLMVFVDPARDPEGAGYNLAQSKIAIGSGEFAGKGLTKGSQGNLNFLPERHTDFIFSVLGEELGFLGGVLLLGLYFALDAHIARDRGVVERPVRHAHRGRRDVDVAVPGAREHGHDHRAHAHHGYPAALHELRQLVPRHQPCSHGYAPVSVGQAHRRLAHGARPRRVIAFAEVQWLFP